MTLQDLKDQLSNECFGLSKSQAIDQNICVKCKEPALPKCYSIEGYREYYISGLCEECFDKLFFK